MTETKLVVAATEEQPTKTTLGDLKPGMTVRIYQRIKELNPKDKEKERIRNYTFTVLDYWVAQGYIKGYEPKRAGTTYTGIAIAWGNRRVLEGEGVQ